MVKCNKEQTVTLLVTLAMLCCACGPTSAAVLIEGKVQAGSGPVANSIVTLWAATGADPRQLSQTRTTSNGDFELASEDTLGTVISLYVIAEGGEARGSGDNSALAMLAVVGNPPPSTVVINEMTTVASEWTHAQFLDDHAIKGNALGLRIAASNVHNFVALATGGYGAAIQDAINSTQTTTMANFATLSSLLAGCTTRTRPDACTRLFAATTPPGGKTPVDTFHRCT